MTSVAYGVAFPASRGALSPPAWTPKALFTGSDTGDWWDVSIKNSLFQNSAGTTPVVNSGDPIGCIKGQYFGRNLTQGTGAAKPFYIVSGVQKYALFDGIDDSLKGVFTLGQPATRISAFRQVTWVLNRYVFDGGSLNWAGLLQYPNSVGGMQMYAGAFGPAVTTTVGANHVVVETFNGASATIAVDNGSAVTGSVGSNSPGGFTVGTNGSGTTPSNIFWFGSVFIGRVLTAAEIARCKTYYGVRAGLTL